MAITRRAVLQGLAATAFGAIAGDLVVTTVVALEAQDFSWSASIATAAAITAVVIFVGCLLGSCHPLKLW